MMAILATMAPAVSAGTALGVLLLGAAAVAEPAPPSAPSLRVKIEEVARMLGENPRFKNETFQQRSDRVEFVVGNTLFVLLHEIGHVLIDEMKLPVLGREEDAVDAFAALRMLRRGTSFSERVLAGASQGWFLTGRRDQQTRAKPLYYDEHSLSEQRAYQIVCLMVGSDPAKFKKLAEEARMPEDRQESCKKDYAKASTSWDTALKPFLRAPDMPPTKIDVVYHEASGDLERFARAFRTVQILELVAQNARADFAWPAPFTLEMRSCDSPQADWDNNARIAYVCYNQGFDYAQLYRAYVRPAPAPALSKKQTRR